MKHSQNIIFAVGASLIALVGAIPRPDIEAIPTDGKIPNSYIVVLKDDARPVDFTQHLSWLQRTRDQASTSQFAGTKNKYNIGTFKGYSGEFDELTVARIKARPEVAFIEQDGVVTASSCTNQSIAPANGEWGLGRISHKQVGPWDKYLYNNNNSTLKRRLYAYVIDSGVQSSHIEFENRATQIWRFDPSWPNDDSCGHGTHVAGIIGGKTYGVEKRAYIYGVKVLNQGGWGSCSGSWAGVIAGLNFAYNHTTGNRASSVVNMSLGGAKSTAVNKAVENCIFGGLTVVVAAGNEGGDACGTSPASVPKAITVGATNIKDGLPEWTNRGCCVDLFAPGVNIRSTYISSGTNSTMILDGTSMAAPYVTGIILSNKGGNSGLDTPAKDMKQLQDNATVGVISGNRCIKGCCTPNALAYNGGCSA